MSTNTSSTKNGSQDMPINYAALSQAYIEAIETTLTDHGVNETAEIINEISSHADSLIELNGEEFIWKNDLEHFMDIIDPLCDTLYSNGYEDIIGRLDDLRQEKLELPKTPDGMDDIIIDESGIELATNLNKSTYGNRWGEITFSSEGIGVS